MSSNNPTYVVAVTGLNAVDSPGPGIAVIRAIRESKNYDVKVIGLSYESLEPGIYMAGMCDKVYQIPYPSAGSEALLQRLEYINDQEKVQVIIPNFDAELAVFIKLSGKLLAMGIHTFLPTPEQLEMREKINLFNFGKKFGFSVPKDQALYNYNELPAVTQWLGYPIVIKGKFYEATVCNTLEEAQKAFRKLQGKWGLPIIAQEFIKGTEVNIAALGDGNGNTVSAVPMRKLFITDKGKAWAGISIDDQTLIELAHSFIKATQWRGPFELEVMMSQSNIPYIMEINPRFPAWIYLSAGAGQNQPEAYVRLALGETVEPYTDYSVGKMFIRYSWDNIVDVSQFQTLASLGEL